MLLRKRTIAALSAAVPLAAALALGVGVVPASADPVSAKFDGAGSDTIQDVMQQMSRTLVSNGATGTSSFNSWNATDPSTGTTGGQITVKGHTLYRPNGSGDGINALLLSKNVQPVPPGAAAYAAAHGAVPAGTFDFARSSRGPADTTGSLLTFIPFATDAVDYAVSNSDTAVSNLSVADLSAIYHCSFGPTHNNVLADGSIVQPYVPQPGSGTRSFFESAVGIADSAVSEDAGTALPATCQVRDHKVGAGTLIEEHDGRVLTDPTVGGTQVHEIVPISIAQHVAQSTTAQTGVPSRVGNSVLGTLAGVSPLNSTGTMNASAWPTAFKRSVYNVFKTTDVTGLLPTAPALANLFVGSGSPVCSSGAIGLFGFAPASAISGVVCGETTIKGNA